VARTTKTRTDGDARERAIAWRRSEHARICDVIEPHEYGTSVQCTFMPTFWFFNSLRVEGPDSGVSADALVHAADVVQGHLAHRLVEVNDEAAGARLRPGFEALGWLVEALAWLRLDGQPADAQDMDEVPFPETRALRLEWAGDPPWNVGVETAQRFSEHEDKTAELRGSRALLAPGGAGFVSFRREGDTAEIEQVYVTESQRGRGIGGALVTAAVRAAGASETYIVADDNGDSKRLYERLGFRPVWVQHVFTRRPG
jgi:ribosomal protein S18 acetylase RimI-like enzyme